MKTTMLTAVAALLASTSLAFAAGPYTNTSTIDQYQNYNAAVVAQINGNNTQRTTQYGFGHNSDATNFAVTGQIAVPDRDHDRMGRNNSTTYQYGQGNTAITGQFAEGRGANSSNTSQTGGENFAFTGQLASGGGTNSSNITQLGTSATGSDNAVVTVQRASWNVNNTSSVLQDGTHNFALTVQTSLHH